jgi:hypothetical protein
MREMGKGLIVLGLMIAAIGAAIVFLPRWRMPGDIVYRSKNVTFYFPIVTSLLLSAALTLLFWLISYFRR